MSEKSELAQVTFEVPTVPQENEEDEGAKEESAAEVPPSDPQQEKQPDTKPAAKKEGNKKKSKKKNFKSSSSGKGRSGPHIDVLGPVAMDNAMYICHSVQDLLAWRGYPWPQTQAKAGGKKKKK